MSPYRRNNFRNVLESRFDLTKIGTGSPLLAEYFDDRIYVRIIMTAIMVNYLTTESFTCHWYSSRIKPRVQQASDFSLIDFYVATNSSRQYRDDRPPWMNTRTWLFVRWIVWIDKNKNKNSKNCDTYSRTFSISLHVEVGIFIYSRLLEFFLKNNYIKGIIERVLDLKK